MLHADMHATGFLLDPEYFHKAQNSNEEVMDCFYKLVKNSFLMLSNDYMLLANQLTQVRYDQGISGRPTLKAASSWLYARVWLNFEPVQATRAAELRATISQSNNKFERRRMELEFGCISAIQAMVQLKDHNNEQAGVLSCQHKTG